MANKRELNAVTRRLKRGLFVLFTIPVAVYALYAGVMYNRQLQFLFPGTTEQHHPFIAKLPEGDEEVEVPVSFGNARFVYLHARGTTKSPAIVFAHGNFDRATDFVAGLTPLAESGFAVVSLEYPGYDGADGKPSFESLNETATAAYDWLARRPEIDATRIVGVGYSMGGGMIGELSKRRPLAALALLSTYSSIADMANRFALPSALVRIPFDNAARVAEFKGPIFIQHGRLDTVIPFRYGEKLVAASGNRATFLPMNCGHADCDFAKTIFRSTLGDWLRAQHVVD